MCLAREVVVEAGDYHEMTRTGTGRAVISTGRRVGNSCNFVTTTPCLIYAQGLDNLTQHRRNTEEASPHQLQPNPQPHPSASPPQSSPPTSPRPPSSSAKRTATASESTPESSPPSQTRCTPTRDPSAPSSGGPWSTP